MTADPPLKPWKINRTIPIAFDQIDTDIFDHRCLRTLTVTAAENGALSGAEVSEQDNHAAELYDILRRKEEE